MEFAPVAGLEFLEIPSHDYDCVEHHEPPVVSEATWADGQPELMVTVCRGQTFNGHRLIGIDESLTHIDHRIIAEGEVPIEDAVDSRYTLHRLGESRFLLVRGCEENRAGEVGENPEFETVGVTLIRGSQDRVQVWFDDLTEPEEDYDDEDDAE